MGADCARRPPVRETAVAITSATFHKGKR
jgi:hypothetical protein